MSLDHTATLAAPVVHCPKCGNPMQVMNEVKHGGRVTERTYICGCPVKPGDLIVSVYHHNVHYEGPR